MLSEDVRQYNGVKLEQHDFKCKVPGTHGPPNLTCNHFSTLVTIPHEK